MDQAGGGVGVSHGRGRANRRLVGVLSATAVPAAVNLLLWWCVVAPGGSLLSPPGWLPQLFIRHLRAMAYGIVLAAVSAAGLCLWAMAGSARGEGGRAHARACEVCLVVNGLVGGYWALALLAGFVYSLGPTSD